MAKFGDSARVRSALCNMLAEGLQFDMGFRPQIDSAWHRGIRICCKHCLHHMEELILAHVVRSVNEWGVKQKRVLVLTNHHIYRVKYDFDRQTVLHYTCIPLDTICRVEYTIRGAWHSGCIKIITAQRDGRPNLWQAYSSLFPVYNNEEFVRCYKSCYPS